jgi:glyoxalase family protein
VPEGALPFWIERLEQAGVDGVKADEAFGEKRLHFAGPDGDGFALVESGTDTRPAWTKGGLNEQHAIRGFHSAPLRLRDDGATAEFLKFMGYEEVDTADGVRRFAIPQGNGADFIDVETLPNIASARQGAGSVHHIAFAVKDRAAHLEVRKALLGAGYHVTHVYDRNYFWSIYFRTPGGVLFEVATNEPGFDLHSGLLANLSPSGIEAFRSGELGQLLESKARERFRNPAAHTRYIDIDTARECKLYVEGALEKLIRYKANSPEGRGPTLH